MSVVRKTAQEVVSSRKADGRAFQLTEPIALNERSSILLHVRGLTGVRVSSDRSRRGRSTVGTNPQSPTR